MKSARFDERRYTISKSLSGTFVLMFALLMLGCAFWCARFAWADDDEGLVATDGSLIFLAEGQGGVLANSWRFKSGVLEDSRQNAGALNELLQTQDDLSAQSADKLHFGVDVSVWDNTINWGQVATAVDFAIVRCGYGSDYSSQDDKYWLANAKGCQENGIPMGVYLYSYATDATMAKSEARHVVRCMREAGLNASNLALPIYLDLEDSSTTGSDYAAIFEAFRSTLVANGYTEVGIYSNCDWWRNRLSAIRLDANYIWLAHWGVDDPFSGYEDLRWRSYGVWQYGSASSVPGITTLADANYLNESAPFLGAIAMRRLYNPNSGEHFYTSNGAEMSYLVSLGWIYEGVGWRAPVASSTPVFRLYNPNAGEHHYTMSAAERDMLIDTGWNDEGIGWYSDDDEHAVLYREYNPNAFANNHNYTTSRAEHDWLIGLGWEDEGTAWYGVQ